MTSLEPLNFEAPEPDNTSRMSLSLEPVPEHQQAQAQAAASEPPPVNDERAALEEFGRVLKNIQGIWATRECDQFLHELFMDSRGGTRRGFPMNAAEEIMFLVKFNKTVRALPLVDQMGINFAEAFRIVDNADQKHLNPGSSGLWGDAGVGETSSRTVRTPGREQRAYQAMPQKKAGKLAALLPWLILLAVLAFSYKFLLPVFSGGGHG
ncbi:MAG: hypothetical protein KBD39_06185 [Sterolibacterium sp.]|nr:hypothetical protein [Sterolibacterium sp.]MBP9799692.1 hypothetical protein [Sterolibacterium sp.]